MAECLSVLGPADLIEAPKHTENTQAYLDEATKFFIYRKNGFIISEDKDGRVLNMNFYVFMPKDDSNYYQLQIANAKTEKGIGRGASLKQIVKTYGHPFNFRKSVFLGKERWECFYKYDSGFLDFDFVDGVLDTIGVHSKYQPYVN